MPQDETPQGDALRDDAAPLDTAASLDDTAAPPARHAEGEQRDRAATDGRRPGYSGSYFKFGDVPKRPKVKVMVPTIR